MRTVLIAAAAALIAAPAVAQAADQPPGHPAPAKHHRASHASTGGAERPIDNGPNTPEANRAYQGGGVILEGQPGGPAPTPEATPPGQTPRNAVPR